ncbi:MAG: type III-A CRISPR-associated RAMP protein Csm3 [Bacteroidales bacterium]|jgi:CRISPR-associated protein Csm3|nr:type III-A CRISPR-associated RAMP protein Csm3 [Bacteroidales bacterium]MDD4150483.1 type III-A CRISPR-associated RAMP protein Csm3 [Bacteroidales bacterium]
MKTLIKKIKVSAKLRLETGLHIGGSKDNVEIGGIDTPVIKIATRKNQPYIPGSSLKGKIRSLLEQINGKELCGDDNINDLFGFTKGNNNSQGSKIIVRDSYLDETSIELLKNASDNLDMPYTENKFENTIDRVKGVTKKGGIRQIERIPAGVTFDVEFIINVWDNEEDGKKSLDLLKKGIAALENDYLGGSGSRGYGQVKFSELKTEDIYFDKYFENEN